jgi:hypothetical protein
MGLSMQKYEAILTPAMVEILPVAQKAIGEMAKLLLAEIRAGDVPSLAGVDAVGDEIQAFLTMEANVLAAIRFSLLSAFVEVLQERSAGSSVTKDLWGFVLTQSLREMAFRYNAQAQVVGFKSFKIECELV